MSRTMRYIAALLAPLALLLAGCEDDLSPGNYGAPSIVSSSASVTEGVAVITCSFSGSRAVKECGVYLGKDDSNFTRLVGSSHGDGTFSVEVGTLDADADYFYKAFLSNGRNEILSGISSFHTEAVADPNPDDDDKGEGGDDSGGGDSGGESGGDDSGDDSGGGDDSGDDPSGDDTGGGDDSGGDAGGDSQKDTTVTPTPPDVPSDTVVVADDVLQTFLLKKFDKDGDGILSGEEAEAVKKIDLETADVTTLEGIENFPNLSYLRVCAEDISGGGSLTSADLSGNPLLKTVDLSCNKLTSITFGANTLLTTLRLGHNSLAKLSLGGLSVLASLDCSYNELTSLWLGANAALQTLDCASNKLASLDVSELSALQTLDCSDNVLTALDLSRNAALVSLVCYGNKIVRLDLTANTALTTVLCSPMETLEEVRLIRGHGYADTRFPDDTQIYYDSL